MQTTFRNLCLAAASALVLGLPAVGHTASPASAAPPSANDFGRVEAIRNVSISPDGNHIAAITSPDGVTPYVSIWNTATAGGKPVNLGCGAAQCMGVRFLKNDRIAVNVREQSTMGNVKTFAFRTMITDLTGSKWRNILGSADQFALVRGQIVDDLVKDPQNILVATNEGYFKVDIYKGASEKVFGSSTKFGSEEIDLKGEIRARQSVEFDNGNVYIIQWIRNPATGAWEEHFRSYAKDRERIDIAGFTDDPNIIYIRTNKGQDKTSIFEYNIKEKKLVEPIFGIKLFDANSVYMSQAAKDYGRILGFSYDGASTEVFWVDSKMESLTKGLREALGVKLATVNWTDIATGEKAKFNVPDGADVSLNSWSDDMRYAIVVKSGSNQPPEYYLLSDQGKLTLLGKSRPWLKTATLGDTRLIQYAARDGLMIPALLTTPKSEIYGPGPYPTLVTPHGGPWARDSMGWDPSGWVQYFAARGYAVLQPQYRGSQGWGQKLWRAGDSEWGQKMQDDKDDGAKYLIEQKIADPKRIAMHGYSYGGYAALAASIRPNGLYQCAIAGAGPSELETFRTSVGENRILREYQRPTINGLEPLDHAAEASIPVFLYHGDRDQRVPIEQSERYAAALRKAGKQVKFTKFKDMGHSMNLWESGQVAQVLTEVDNYLRTECKPGGL